MEETIDAEEVKPTSQRGEEREEEMKESTVET